MSEHKLATRSEALLEWSSFSLSPLLRPRSCSRTRTRTSRPRRPRRRGRRIAAGPFALLSSLDGRARNAGGRHLSNCAHFSSPIS